MLAQAGAAIALATLPPSVGRNWANSCKSSFLGSVVVFEIFGPIWIRWSVLKAGEVPLAQAISHRTETAGSQASKMWMRTREALGVRPKHNPDMQSMQVSALLRGNVSGLAQTAEFDDVISYIRRSHDNTYVVVDDLQRVVGLIRYKLLSDTFFDASMDTLVRAEDLASPPSGILTPSDPLGLAVELFRTSADDILPVVSADDSRSFLGVVRRSDLTDLAMRFAAEGSCCFQLG